MPPHLSLVFELCEASLLDYLAEHSMEPAQRLAVARDCASAVDFLHSEQWLHRDLKLANFLLNQQGRALLTDLGTCVNLRAPPRPSSLVGTLENMAPELVLSFQAEDVPYSQASDVYALAVCVWGALANDPVPFKGLKAWAVRDRILAGDAPYDSALDVGGDAVPVVRRCWDRSPAARPAASEVCAALEACFKRRSGLQSPPLPSIQAHICARVNV